MNRQTIYKKWWIGTAIIVAIIAVLLILNLIGQPDRPEISSKNSPQASKEFRMMSPAEHISHSKKSIEMKNYVAAITHLDAIPKESPEYAEATILRNQINENQKKQAIENKIAADDRNLKEIDAKIIDMKTKLKKDYATADDVMIFLHYVTILEIIENRYKNGSSDSEKRLQATAAALLPKAQQALREVYASSVEDNLIKAGMNARVRAEGKGKETLRITYALMSHPLVYKLQQEIKIDEKAKDAGFSKLIYTNGFAGSSGSTWNVSLK